MTTEQFIKMLEAELECIKKLAEIHARLVELGDKMEAAPKRLD